MKHLCLKPREVSRTLWDPTDCWVLTRICCAAYFSTPVHFVSAISSYRLRERKSYPPRCCGLNPPPNTLVDMEMLRQQYQVKEFIQFTEWRKKRDWRQVREWEGSQEWNPLVTSVLSLCVRLDKCASHDTAGTLGWMSCHQVKRLTFVWWWHVVK